MKKIKETTEESDGQDLSDPGGADKTFVCAECGEAFDSKRGRGVHRSQAH